MFCLSIYWNNHCKAGFAIWSKLLSRRPAEIADYSIRMGPELYQRLARGRKGMTGKTTYLTVALGSFETEVRAPGERACRALTLP